LSDCDLTPARKEKTMTKHSGEKLRDVGIWDLSGICVRLA